MDSPIEIKALYGIFIGCDVCGEFNLQYFEDPPEKHHKKICIKCNREF